MKRCLVCNRTYADETLTFCLADGSLLSAPYDSNATLHQPIPQSTHSMPTEVLPPAMLTSEAVRQRGSKWKIYLLIPLLLFIILGGIVAVLKLAKNNTPPIQQSSTNSNQPDVSKNNGNKEDTSSPSWKLVGVWRANVSEFGKKSEITVTWNADGTVKVLIKDAQGQGTADGMWRYSSGIVYETYSDGSSGKGSVKWIDNNTLELTIIDNGVPAYSGLKRIYHRIK